MTYYATSIANQYKLKIYKNYSQYIKNYFLKSLNDSFYNNSFTRNLDYEFLLFKALIEEFNIYFTKELSEDIFNKLNENMTHIFEEKEENIIKKQSHLSISLNYINILELLKYDNEVPYNIKENIINTINQVEKNSSIEELHSMRGTYILYSLKRKFKLLTKDDNINILNNIENLRTDKGGFKSELNKKNADLQSTYYATLILISQGYLHLYKNSISKFLDLTYDQDKDVFSMFIESEVNLVSTFLGTKIIATIKKDERRED